MSFVVNGQSAFIKCFLYLCNINTEKRYGSCLVPLKANELIFELFLPFPSRKYLTALKAPTVINNTSLFLSINSFEGLLKINVSYAMTLFVVFFAGPYRVPLHSLTLAPCHPRPLVKYTPHCTLYMAHCILYNYIVRF